jgi:hypothetical protein
MIRSTYRLTVACALSALLGLLLAGPSPARAEEAVKPAAVATQPEAKPEAAATQAAAEVREPAAELRDPEALAELKRATDFLTALPRFTLKATVAYDVIQNDGRRLQFEKEGNISLQRPDRVFAEIHFDDGRHRKVWYDGKTLSIAELSKKLHTQTKAPPTIDGMLDMLEVLLKNPLPLADLFYSNLSPLEQRAEEADIVEDSLVDGRPCTHLAFRGETVDWQIWVEQGVTPFIRKLAISYREEPGTPQFFATLDLWETPERFNDDLFTFVAPAGSQWIDVLVPTPRRSTEGAQP